MKKDKEWLKGRFAGRKIFSPLNDREIGYNKAIDEFSEYVDQLDEPEVTLDKAFEKVAESYSMTKEEILRHLERLEAHGGKVTYGEPEVLSQEWVDSHTDIVENNFTDEVYLGVRRNDLQNLFVPKQELPVIPKFVAQWIEFKKKSEISYDNIFQAINELYKSKTSRAHNWVLKTDENKDAFARAWLDGYEVEQEPKYFAKIKGHENINSDDKYWNYCTTDESLDIGSNKVHPDVSAKYVLSATKDEWEKLGINDDNADFVKVEELEE